MYDPADFAPDEAGYEEWCQRRDKEEKQAACPHESFMANVAVGRLQAGEGGPVTRFSADVRIECVDCGVQMKFVGLPMGVDLNGAAVSIDGKEARLACFPENRPHPSNLKDEPPGFRIVHDIE